jgi:unsaturated rhamnogalacturonyl hydrolase
MTYVNDHDGQLWCDTLFMSVLPLAKIGRLLERQSFIDEAKYQMLLHVKYLVDVSTGLL